MVKPEIRRQHDGGRRQAQRASTNKAKVLRVCRTMLLKTQHRIVKDVEGSYVDKKTFSPH